MADDHWSSFITEAVTSVATLLEGDLSTKKLTKTELATYAKRGPIAGWQVTLPITCVSNKVDLLLPSGFPWKPPVVVLVGRPPFREWPHVERDGTLCLLGDSATIDASNPCGVIRYLLTEATALVTKLADGELRDDFRSEFKSYWPETNGNECGPVISVCGASAPSRNIRCWLGRDFLVIGDNDEDIRGWLFNRGRGRGETPPRTRPAVFAHLAELPLPDDYPDSGASLLAFLDHHAPEAAALAKSAISEDTEELVIALCATTERGPALFAAVMGRPQAASAGNMKRPDPVRKGFRRGRIPPATLVPRLFSGQGLRRVNVERADASWIHGRDHGDGLERLRAAHVVFVGCGSLGSPVIRLLAQTGLGSMTVIDPDVLGWPNLGRHVLGAGSVGKSKASALVQTIRGDFPHVRRADSITDSVETLLMNGSDQIRHADVIVSTTADWPSNNALNHWALGKASAVPFVYGWLEPRACAGHAAAFCPPVGCLRCGFDATGRPLFRVTNWEGDEVAMREPACGASFQPYGPTEVTMVAAMVADTVLDVLLGRATLPTHRIWATRDSVLQRDGGRWTSEWLARSPDPAPGGMLMEQPWGLGATCGSCTQRLTA